MEVDPCHAYVVGAAVILNTAARESVTGRRSLVGKVEARGFGVSRDRTLLGPVAS